MNSTHLGIGMTSQRTRERLVDRLARSGVSDQRVLDVIRVTPRHLFMDEALASRAYEDTALPIGYGQTISQPFVVARMTETLLAGEVPRRVLEVGTGSGYQTAVLAQLIPDVYSVERISELVTLARRRFRELGLTNIRAQHSDGSWGWPERAPFDAILVTAAPEEVPQALLTQLAVGGQLILPVGSRREQHLSVIRRTATGFEQELMERVKFVPMLGGVS